MTYYITNLTRSDSDNALAVPAAHHFHRAEARCDVLAYIGGAAHAATTVVHSHDEGAPRVIVGDLGEIGAFAAYTVLSA